MFCCWKILTATVIEDMEMLFWKIESEIKKIQTKLETLTISWYHASCPTNRTQKKTGKEHCRKKHNVTWDSDWWNLIRVLGEFRFAGIEKRTFLVALMGYFHPNTLLWQSRLFRNFQLKTFWEVGNCRWELWLRS